MSLSPSARFGLDAAPGGLALVQNFLNTRAIESHGLPDLLSDSSTAHAVVNDCLTVSSYPVLAIGADALALRSLRTAVEEAVAGEVVKPQDVGLARMTVDSSGVVHLLPQGDGYDYVASALWSEILLAQYTDTWRRLKRCRNIDCGSAFYDRSKNNSGVWHNVKTCGNAANLRASRARKASAQRVAE